MKIIDQRDSFGGSKAGIGLKWSDMKLFVDSLSTAELENPAFVRDNHLPLGYAFIAYLGPLQTNLTIGTKTENSVLAKAGHPTIMFEE